MKATFAHLGNLRGWLDIQRKGYRS